MSRGFDKNVDILVIELSQLVFENNDDWQIAIPLLSENGAATYKIITDGYRADAWGFEDVYRNFISEVRLAVEVLRGREE